MYQSTVERAGGVPDPKACIAILAVPGRSTHELSSVLRRAGLDLKMHERLTGAIDWISNVDLVLLDPDLGPRGGLSACSEIRKLGMLPVLVVGRKMDPDERVAYLDHGADDVLDWPIGEPELLARVRAQLRRRAMPTASRLIRLRADRGLDLENSLVHWPGQTYSLTPTEARLARCLADKLGQPLSVRHLVEAVWGRRYESESDRDLLRATIYRLRRKLETDPKNPEFLRFTPGQGWVLSQPRQTRKRSS